MKGRRRSASGPDFLGWLTDPEKNGAGAMFDFGCYGADLMTAHARRNPAQRHRRRLTDKPEIYPKVDDDATIIVRYPKAQAVLQPSWNWPFSPQGYGSLRRHRLRHHRSRRPHAHPLRRRKAESEVPRRHW
jgi:predicted dehydrogenase